jgi:hypothetical protein
MQQRQPLITQHRARRSGRRTLLLLLTCAAAASAQSVPTSTAAAAAPRSWQQRLDATIVAGAFVRPVSLSLDGVDRKNATGLYGEFGVRVAPIAVLCGARPGASCKVLARITLAPHASLGATHLRGIEARTGESAFSTFELLGVRAAYPITRRIVPYVVYRRGKHASEQFESGDVVNLWGPGTTRGVGLELPFTPLGRGLSIAFTQQRGRFESIETRDVVRNKKVISNTARDYRATSWQIGWSGPFTGVTWPWQ